ncbi:MAG: UDP-N-acetylmuramate:L-alanyl-gamma-D-glutamyl-meso-diaminopimelate ligase [Gammaproteobacteria bacterium]|nr:UDP-N-acetylmuramate:L-alanyl-gamma-D-glutamyl-meso-diaminopimelate ligase [Gammaproteobacteria bacterium]MDH3388085.1 UDP-N-acetylmuramate:L-alanyl-gamma-D-glutamyl-meso-diaminopimelate ligase [Gammaproteobacteria bacterium]
MKIYVLGICGTFMAGIALIARELGYEVEGSDANVYPPMSTQLEQAGIGLHDGYDAATLPADCDIFIVGNAITRGNPQFEAILDRGLRYTSGPQWLYEKVLQPRWVLAVAGTHGKTTTSSMLAWILEEAGLDPGYLIGGIGQNFSRSAKLGSDPFFVIEADEYDSALFDKRSKFIHYHPRTLILNNLEFDHADIFDDLAAIKRQFHHLVRSLPASALIIVNHDDAALRDVMQMGCWSERVEFSTGDASADFYLDPGKVLHQRGVQAAYPLELAQHGQFNALNAAAAIIAARHAGVAIDVSLRVLRSFAGVRRRQEVIAEIDGVRIVDDFAHHPTAIALTLQALKGQTDGRLIAVVDIRSNTMKMGAHAAQLGQSFAAADLVLLCENPNLEWDMQKMAESAPTIVEFKPDSQHIIDYLLHNTEPGDQIVIMSNGGFDDIHQRLIKAMRD